MVGDPYGDDAAACRLRRNRGATTVTVGHSVPTDSSRSAAKAVSAGPERCFCNAAVLPIGLHCMRRSLLCRSSAGCMQIQEEVRCDYTFGFNFFLSVIVR